MVRFATFSLVLLILVLGGASLGKSVWVLDLLAHFMLLYWLLALLLLTYFLAKKEKLKSYLSLACVIYTSVLLAQIVLQRAPMAKIPREEGRVRIFEFHAGGNEETVKNWLPIHAPDYDVVVLLEASLGFQELVEKLKAEFPYQVVHLESGPFGMVILSRWEITEAKEFQTEGGAFPQYQLQIHPPSAGDSFLLFAVHAPPPLAPQLAEAHEAILGELAEKLQQKKLPAIVVGNLNTTPGSQRFAELLKKAQLRDTAGISPWANTWPSLLVNYVSILGIRIDHCLVSNSFSIVERDRLGDLGSPHLPLRCVVQLEK